MRWLQNNFSTLVVVHALYIYLSYYFYASSILNRYMSFLYCQCIHPHDLVNFLDYHVLILVILCSCGTKVAWAGPLLVMWILILTFIFLSIMKLCTVLYLFLCMDALALKMLCLGRTGCKLFFWGHICSELGCMIGLLIIIWCWIQRLSF